MQRLKIALMWLHENLELILGINIYFLILIYKVVLTIRDVNDTDSNSVVCYR